MIVREIQAKSILVRSKLPGVDYVINPYTGCQFGCLYCYASFMSRYVNEPLESWGNYVYAKINTVELFEKEFARIKSKKEPPSLFLSSVTDPYQGPEMKYRLTRGVLEILARDLYPGSVGILTKSPLVLRDIDLFKQLADIEVGLTVTSTDDDISRFLEVHAPAATRRLEALAKLVQEGIPTYAFIGPLLPHFRYDLQGLDDLFAAIAGAGVKSLYVEQINMKPYIMERLQPVLGTATPEIQQIYREATQEEHFKDLRKAVQKLIAKYRFELRSGEIIEHSEG